MSGKFMSVKRIVIPTITLVIIASQLMACASASQSELLSMINQGQAIEIEVATPINEEQGTEQSLDWEQLALLTTNPDLRKSMDDILMISNTDTGKNGVLYVNSDGENEPNNTLRVALHNREFVKFLEDDSSLSELAEAAADNYVDVEADVDDLQKAVYMGINGYFNLLPDSSPNYANPDSTIQRNEFMAMVFRAETPVQDLEADSTFATAVGTSDYNLYAQGVVDSSYLDLASQSLNNMTYNGTITRAEAIYLLVTRYFADDYANLDLKSDSTTFTDAKDGGNIAEDQKFIEDATEKSYWKSYELTYALQNPDKGLPTDLYKALVVASNKGLISAETRWDEGLTKSEAIELLVETLEQEQGIDIFNAKQGTIEGYEAPADQDQSESVNIEEYEGGNGMGEDAEIEDEYDQAYQDQLDAESAESDESDSPTTTPSSDFEVQSLDSQTKYAKQQVNVRKGPGIDYEKTGSLSTNEEVTVIGLVPTDHGDWYQLGDPDRTVVGYVSATYLVDTKVAVSTTNNNSGTSSTASNSGNSGSTSNSSSSSSSSSSGASSNFGGLDVTGFDTSGGTITGGKDGSHASDGVGSGQFSDITVY
jgi:hypothetical protein